MKALLLILFCVLGLQSVHAEESGGLNKNVAPPPPHKIEDGYRGTDDERVMTVKFAKTMPDGATLTLRGNLIDHQGDDRYVFRDQTDTINVIIPKAVFDGREVQPDQMIKINGSLDKKMTPPIVRINHFQK